MRKNDAGVIDDDPLMLPIAVDQLLWTALFEKNF